MKNGSKSFSVTAPAGYPNKDIESEQVAYERSYPVKHYYVCKSSDGKYTKYSLEKCGTGDSRNFPKQIDEFDSCVKVIHQLNKTSLRVKKEQKLADVL